MWSALEYHGILCHMPWKVYTLSPTVSWTLGLGCHSREEQPLLFLAPIEGYVLIGDERLIHLIYELRRVS